MIKFIRRKPKENAETIQKDIDQITRRLFRENQNQKIIDSYYKERR